ncbi:MAG: PilZ domain-containing protein [Azovibrio sp.]|uniref:PilZ domain-containing protein n=1 Tax=Azovibrio sp. TaxID=1872673 RepID=UPI003C765F40
MPENRVHKRFHFHWPVALVFDHFKDKAKNTTYHGTTHELSLSGCSLLTDYNVYSNHPLTLLISLPAESPLGKRKVLEIRARMCYTLLACDIDRFRSGIEFMNFKGDARHQLQQAIESRIQGTLKP